MRETWKSLIRDFVRHLKGTNCAVITQTIHRRAARSLVQFLRTDGQLPAPRALTRRHLEAYMAHLIDTRSASTANVVYRELQQFLRWLLDEEIDRSPIQRMHPPIGPEKPVPVLTEAQLRVLLASARSTSFVDRRDAAIIRLLLVTGGRLSELAGLAVADLDFTDDVAHAIGKGRRPRALPFGQQTGLALGRYLRARAGSQPRSHLLGRGPRRHHRRRRHARPPPAPLGRAQPRRRQLPAPRPPRPHRHLPPRHHRHPLTANLTRSPGGDSR